MYFYCLCECSKFVKLWRKCKDSSPNYIMEIASSLIVFLQCENSRVIHVVINQLYMSPLLIRACIGTLEFKERQNEQLNNNAQVIFYFFNFTRLTITILLIHSIYNVFTELVSCAVTQDSAQLKQVTSKFERYCCVKQSKTKVKSALLPIFLQLYSWIVLFVSGLSLFDDTSNGLEC